MCETIEAASDLLGPPRVSFQAGRLTFNDDPRPQHLCRQRRKANRPGGEVACGRRAGTRDRGGARVQLLILVNAVESPAPRPSTIAESVSWGCVKCWMGRRYSWTSLPNMKRGATTSCRGGRATISSGRLVWPSELSPASTGRSTNGMKAKALTWSRSPGSAIRPRSCRGFQEVRQSHSARSAHREPSALG